MLSCEGPGLLVSLSVCLSEGAFISPRSSSDGTLAYAATSHRAAVDNGHIRGLLRAGLQRVTLGMWLGLWLGTGLLAVLDWVGAIGWATRAVAACGWPQGWVGWVGYMAGSGLASGSWSRVVTLELG